MLLTTIAIITLIAGATADGFSTVYAIGKGNHEVDPVMLIIYGTNKPSAKMVFVRGAIAIALESAITLTAGHFSHPAGVALGITLLVQSAYHFWATRHNYKSVQYV